MTLPASLALWSLLSSSWQSGVLNPHFFAFLVLVAGFFAIGGVLVKLGKLLGTSEIVGASNVHFVAGSLYAYALLWRSLHAALPSSPDLAVMIALIIYTLISIVMYIYGARIGHKGLRAYGGVLLGAVVVRLLLVDVWNMEITGRIITFFLVGALMMSTAFMGRLKKENADSTS